MATPTDANEGLRLEDLYSDDILRFAGNITRIGRLPAPDATVTREARLCGSVVTVDLTVENGVVTDFAHEVRACALGQASSSIMARKIIGATTAELLDVRDQMLAMLTQGDPPPTGRFADLALLLPVRDYKPRHASTMLTFDAVVEAIRQIESRETAKAERTDAQR
jgi:NifU-like protein involved in Fe-S cluster formation